jgi:hypothetical protein
VTEKLLDRPDIVTAFQQVSCEGIAKGVTVHVGQESVNSLFGHIGWLPLGIEEYEPFDPMAIGLLSSSAVMAGAQGFAETVQKFWFWRGLRRNPWVSADWIWKNWCEVSPWHRLPSPVQDN